MAKEEFLETTLDIIITQELIDNYPYFSKFVEDLLSLDYDPIYSRNFFQKILIANFRNTNFSHDNIHYILRLYINLENKDFKNNTEQLLTQKTLKSIYGYKVLGPFFNNNIYDRFAIETPIILINSNIFA